jgi:hypothetical protein
MFTPTVTPRLQQRALAPDAINRLVGSPGQRQELLILARVLADLAPADDGGRTRSPDLEGSTRPGGQTQEEGQAA